MSTNPHADQGDGIARLKAVLQCADALTEASERAISWTRPGTCGRGAEFPCRHADCIERAGRYAAMFTREAAHHAAELARLVGDHAEVSRLAAALAEQEQRVNSLERDAEWRGRWHKRLGRGILTEGRFYEKLEGELLRTTLAPNHPEQAEASLAAQAQEIKEREAERDEARHQASVLSEAKQEIIDALTKERDALKAEKGWQPIETAPKDDDGTGVTPQIILGFAADEEGYTLPSREGYWSLSLRRWVSSLDPGWKDGPEPTHWQPLPAPPDPEAK